MKAYSDDYYLLCEDCGNIFLNSEALRDYTDGGDRGEEHCSCHRCEGDTLLEVEQCAICGKWTDDSNGGVCASCLCKRAEDVDMVVRYGAQRPEKVEINGFLAAQFSERQINDILLNEFKKSRAEWQKFCSKEWVLDDDLNDLAAFIIKEQEERHGTDRVD